MQRQGEDCIQNDPENSVTLSGEENTVAICEDNGSSTSNPNSFAGSSSESQCATCQANSSKPIGVNVGGNLQCEHLQNVTFLGNNSRPQTLREAYDENEVDLKAAEKRIKKSFKKMFNFKI